MFYSLFDLIELILPSWCFSPERQYEDEKLHWRIGGIFLALIAAGIWFLDDLIGLPYCFLICAISCILLVVHLIARAALIKRNRDSLDQ